MFTNVDHFSNSIDKAITKCSCPGISPLHNFVLSPAPKQIKTPNKSFVARIFASNKEDYEKSNHRKAGEVEHLVIDCSGFTFIDFTSVSALIDVFKRLQKKGVAAYFAEAKGRSKKLLFILY